MKIVRVKLKETISHAVFQGKRDLAVEGPNSLRGLEFKEHPNGVLVVYPTGITLIPFGNIVFVDGAAE